MLGNAVPDRAVKTVVSLQHCVNYLLVAAASEWRLPTEHDVHHYAHRPVVTLGGVASLEHLGRNVVGSAVGRIHDLVFADSLREPEVNQLDVGVIILFEQQEVFGLDISVADLVVVEVAESVKRLAHDGRSLRLCQVLPLGDVEKQLASLAQPTQIRGLDDLGLSTQTSALARSPKEFLTQSLGSRCARSPTFREA